MVENGETGVYNATGPASLLTIGGMLGGIKTALDARANFTWVSAEFLNAQKVEPWSDMPAWIPPRGEMLGFASLNVKKAIGKGLTFRPLAGTARDTLKWFKGQSPERQAKLHAGLPPARETEVLAAWRARQPKK